MNKNINAKTDVIFIIVNNISFNTLFSGFFDGSIKLHTHKVIAALNKYAGKIIK